MPNCPLNLSLHWGENFTFGRCQLGFMGLSNSVTNWEKTLTQTLDMMKQAWQRSIQRSLVFWWHKIFKDGREEVHDEHRIGRRKSRVMLIGTVRDDVYADRHVRVRDICDITGIPYGTMQHILVEELHMIKLCARWIPRIFTNDNKESRVNASRKFLRRYSQQGNELLWYFGDVSVTDYNFIILNLFFKISGSRRRYNKSPIISGSPLISKDC